MNNKNLITNCQRLWSVYDSNLCKKQTEKNKLVNEMNTTNDKKKNRFSNLEFMGAES